MGIIQQRVLAGHSAPERRRIHTVASMNIVKLLTDNPVSLPTFSPASGNAASDVHAFDCHCARLDMGRHLMLKASAAPRLGGAI